MTTNQPSRGLIAYWELRRIAQDDYVAVRPVFTRHDAQCRLACCA